MKLIAKTINTALSPEQNPLQNMKERNIQAERKQLERNNFLKHNFSTNQPQVNPQLMLNNAQQAAIMREMLQLPQELRDLLELLMAQNKKITPESLKELLQTNSKDVITRLIRLIQQSPNNQQNHEQLRQLISLLNQITPARDATPQEVVTQMLLLYLPWLPLLEQQKIEVAFEKKNSESEEVDESVAMIVYISTINFGRFKVTIFVDKKKNNNLDIIIQNIEGQEKEVLKNILKEIKSGIKEENITAETQMMVVKQKNFEKSEERKITISQVNNLSPMVLVAAKKIAQVIFEFDEKAGLLEKREKEAQE